MITETIATNTMSGVIEDRPTLVSGEKKYSVRSCRKFKKVGKRACSREMEDRSTFVSRETRMWEELCRQTYASVKLNK
jgi:hypothetical protein